MSGIAGIIGAGAQVAGSIGSLIGARKDKLAAENSALKSWQRNYDAQKEFAQNSIQWRVQDAKAAGINPYAVISGQTAGYTPQDTSYQTSYQAAASQAMNGLSDAMGQLNLAMAEEDLKGKKLENDKKAVELMNEQIASSLGQTDKTTPPFPGFTRPVQKATGMMLVTNADGEQYFLPGNEDADFSPAYLRQLFDAMYGRKQYADAAEVTGRHIPALGALGFYNVPSEQLDKNVSNIRAAEVARDYGTVAGMLSLPYFHTKEAFDFVGKRLQRLLGLRKR